MPALSPTMTQGNIAKWYVKVGDEISAGTVLADIETDKATLAFENQEDGFIAAIVKPEGSKDVPVGETVAVVVEESSYIAAFANYSGDAAAETPSASVAPPAESRAPAASAGASGSGSWPEHTVSRRFPASIRKNSRNMYLCRAQCCLTWQHINKSYTHSPGRQQACVCWTLSCHHQDCSNRA